MSSQIFLVSGGRILEKSRLVGNTTPAILKPVDLHQNSLEALLIK